MYTNKLHLNVCYFVVVAGCCAVKSLKPLAPFFVSPFVHRLQSLCLCVFFSVCRCVSLCAILCALLCVHLGVLLCVSVSVLLCVSVRVRLCVSVCVSVCVTWCGPLGRCVHNNVQYPVTNGFASNAHSANLLSFLRIHQRMHSPALKCIYAVRQQHYTCVALKTFLVQQLLPCNNQQFTWERQVASA